MARKLVHRAVVTAAAVTVTAMLTTAAAGTTPRASHAPATTTPIKHVVVIIGENHSFDNVFATYQPPGHQKIMNLLSEGIVTQAGLPGPNFSKAAQFKSKVTTGYTVTPPKTGAYKTLPQPNTTYVSQACSGLKGDSNDTRFPADLPNGPFQITHYVPYFDSHLQYSQFGQCELFSAYVGDPLHRFYQMWQQMATPGDHYQTWVHQTAGDDNGAVPPAPISRARSRWASTTWPRVTRRSCTTWR